MKPIALRLLCACLTLAVLLGLTACGSTVEEDTTLTGTWSYQFEFPTFGIEHFTQHLTLTFFEDGTLGFSPDEAAMRREIEAHIDALVTYAIEQGGQEMTVQEYYDTQQITEADMIDEIVSSLMRMGAKGTYEVDGDKLYFLFGTEEKVAENYYTHTFENGQLVLSVSEGFSPMFSLAPPEQFPLRLSRT